MLTWIITVGVNPGHLAKMVFIRFLHYSLELSYYVQPTIKK